MKYYNLEVDDHKAILTIFDYINSDAVSVKDISADINEIPENINEIHVKINSYGGEVAEGLAIYNLLKNCGKTVVTYCFGFACSIASVIFMAGSKRIMLDGSMLMIHDPWTFTAGNAVDLRKEAEILDKIGDSLADVYHASGLAKSEISAMLATETWMTATEAYEKGFATRIERVPVVDKYAACAGKSVVNWIIQAQKEKHTTHKVKQNKLKQFFNMEVTNEE